MRDLVYLGQTDRVFLLISSGSGTAYALMKKKGDADNLLLYGLTAAEWPQCDLWPGSVLQEQFPYRAVKLLQQLIFIQCTRLIIDVFWQKDNRLSYYDIDKR